MKTSKTVIGQAQDAFWAVIAKAHPTVKTGDLSPDASHKFDCDCEKAVIYWEQANVPQGPLAILLALGFEKCSTGGGCEAYEYTRPDGAQCLVTNDAEVPKAGEHWDVGFYPSEDQKIDGGAGCVTYYSPGQLNEALAVIAAWRVG